MLGADEEPNRLRALLTLMREFGATKVVTPDGFVLERPPLSPLEAAVVRAQHVPTAASTDDDVDEDLDAEEAEEQSLRAQWTEYWQRLTLSSGASIPAFPGRERALRLLGAS